MSDWDKEMEKALELDGEKLRQLTGEDHGPWTVQGRCAQIAEEEAVDAYRNPGAANYRSREAERAAHVTAMRIARRIRALDARSIADRHIDVTGTDQE